MSLTEQECSTSERQRLATLARAGSRCEAEVQVQAGSVTVWTRCFASPVEVHHALTRSRGGDLLDEVGEDHHLSALCVHHHRTAHAGGGRALMLEGYVARDSATGRVYYSGPDEYLSEKYPDPRSQL